MNEAEIRIQMTHPEPFNLSSTEVAEIKLNEHVGWIQRHHPDVAHIVANLYTKSPFDLQAKVKALQECYEFSERGRGVQWATTIEQHLKVRRSGASTLLGCLQSESPQSPDESAGDYYLLDVFGGAGFIAQFARDVMGFNGTVLTSDPSPVMVRLALEKGLPAFWQRAQDLFMTRSDSVDAVLFAYGTHHVPVGERLESFKEAWRVLKPGGALVFHDFEEKTPTARWFQEVVDPYTVTGHNHLHFTVDELEGYYRGADFEVELITTIDDCFQFVASTREASRRAAIEFMGGAYGLERLDGTEEASQFLWEKINEIFSVEEIAPGSRLKGGYEIVIHRPALVAVGRKPSGRESIPFHKTKLDREVQL